MASPTDHALARAIADEAGRALTALRLTHADPGARRQALKDAGDASAQRVIAAALANAVPDDAVLSEEAVDTAARLTADRVWIIDPVDGTREFGEPPRDDWAVHVALWERAAGPQGDLTVGAVALPGMDLTLGTDEPPTLPGPADTVRIVVSRTRPPQEAHRLAEAMGAVLVPMGSAGAKAMAVVRGVADIYVHSGGQYEWDSAAPVAVARSAGLHTSRIDGAALRYNTEDPYLPDLLICRPELAAQALEILTDGRAVPATDA